MELFCMCCDEFQSTPPKDTILTLFYHTQFVCIWDKHNEKAWIKYHWTSQRFSAWCYHVKIPMNIKKYIQDLTLSIVFEKENKYCFPVMYDPVITLLVIHQTLFSFGIINLFPIQAQVYDCTAVYFHKMQLSMLCQSFSCSPVQWQ